jgi:hypothetical protein
VLTLKLVLPNFSLLKLQALHSSSSLNPNIQPVGERVIARGVWGGWVNRMREVDGLVGGRVVGFRFVGENLR